MDLKELKEKYPDLVDQIRAEANEKLAEDTKAAVDEALGADRARMKAIDEIASMVGDQAMVTKAKYDEPITAEELALVAMRTQAKEAKAFEAARSKEVEAANAVVPTPSSGTEEPTQADVIADAKAAAKAYLDSKGGAK